MSKHRLTHFYPVLVIAILILVSFACGSSATQDLQEAVKPTVAEF